MTLRLVEPPRSGPNPNYSDADVYWAMYLMSAGGSVSRSALSQALGIGEGTAKNILGALRNANLTMTFHTGTKLNRLGMDLIAAIPFVPVDLDIPLSLPGAFRQLVAVSSASVDPLSSKDADGCAVAVREGTGVRSRGMPESAAEEALAAASDAMGSADILVIGFGDTLPEARNRAVRFALSIL